MQNINTINQTTQFSLKSIAGYSEEKEEAIKIINLFKNYESLKELGVSIPKGLILSGMPGVGKTLMAKVIAAEAGVPLYEYEAMEDETQEKGITNLKALYETARNNAPSIVFIDELDELVCSYDYMSDYSRVMLKTLLTEIDGVKNSEGVLTIATTNDYARIPIPLLRSGRMDKHIEFDLPDLDAREAILNLYASDNKLLHDVDFKEVAIKTNAFSCADLKTLINETLLQVVTSNKEFASNEDFQAVIPTILFKGIRKKDHGTSLEQVCYHELGHFICEYELNKNVSEVSIERIGKTEGHTRVYRPGESVRILSFEQCKNQAIVALGGYAAEICFLGQAYTGNSADFAMFEETIYEMASSGMLGSKFIFSAKNRNRSIMRDQQSRNDSLEDIRVKCFDEYLAIANKIVEDNKDLIQFLFEKLKKSETLDAKEMREYIAEYSNH